MLEEIGEAVGGELEELGGLARVEHVDDVEAKVALQPEDIAVGTVEDLDDVGVGKDLVEDVKVVHEGKGVDDEVLLAGRDLNQAGEAEIGTIVVVLQIDGELSRLLEGREQGKHLLVRVDPGEGRGGHVGVDDLVEFRVEEEDEEDEDGRRRRRASFLALSCSSVHSRCSSSYW